MKKLLAGLLAALFLLAPASASPTVPVPPLEQLVAASGCKDVQFFVDPDLALNAYFGVDLLGQKFIFVTLGMLAVEERVLAFVLLHELAHCVQYQEGRLPTDDRVGAEHEADRMAAGWLCGMGLDGIGIGRDFFLWLSGQSDDTLTKESQTHGSYLQRIWSLERAPGCSAQYPAK